MSTRISLHDADVPLIEFSVPNALRVLAPNASTGADGTGALVCRDSRVLPFGSIVAARHANRLHLEVAAEGEGFCVFSGARRSCRKHSCCFWARRRGPRSAEARGSLCGLAADRSRSIANRSRCMNTRGLSRSVIEVQQRLGGFWDYESRLRVGEIPLGSVVDRSTAERLGLRT